MKSGLRREVVWTWYCQWCGLAGPDVPVGSIYSSKESVLEDWMRHKTVGCYGIDEV